ncbi:MAG: GTPase Era [Gemmatimonadota bacterium]|jgi:GTP-binding protein Era|nr:GTPase Era [Gemmatimonadota bacterium]
MTLPEEDGDSKHTRAGYVAIIGLPNSGKSSLLNQLVEQKLSIVTPTAQTTRERVVGIDTREDVQAIYLDTPGLLDPKYLLQESMLHSVMAAVREADLVLWVVDAYSKLPAVPEPIRDMLSALGQSRTIAVLNKADVAVPGQMDSASIWVRNELNADAVAVSARTGKGIEELRRRIGASLPLSPFLYPEDELAIQSTRFFVAELIREAVFELYSQEIPFSVAIKIDEFRETGDPVYIRATIFVERQTQKAILIGRQGTAMKRLGRDARGKIEAFLQTRVYLDLWVKVLPRWRMDPLVLQRLGYSLPSRSTPHA